MVASIIVAILGGAVAASVARLYDSRDRAKTRQAAVTNTYAVTRLIAQDVAGVLRDENLSKALVQVTHERVASDFGMQWDHDEVLIFTQSRRFARPMGEDFEGIEYEVQYRIDGASPEIGGVLWRRADPVVDEYHEGGGVATPLLTGVVSLEVEVYDGEEWTNEWTTDERGYPYGVRVIVRRRTEPGGAIVTARTVVAVDRVPIPIDEDTLAEFDQQLPADQGGLFGDLGGGGTGDLFGGLEDESGGEEGGGDIFGGEGGGGGLFGGGN